MSTRLSEEEKSLVLKLFDQGLNTVQISKQMKRSDFSVAAVLRANDRAPRNIKHLLTEEQIREAYVEYSKGVSLEVVALPYKVNARTIANGFRKYKLPIRKSGYTSDIEHHDFFQTINTEQKAYFLGFVIADGSIHLQKNRSAQLSIMLNQKDIHILHSFCEALGLPRDRVKISSRGECYFRVNSEQLTSDLARYGVVPQKTHISYIPEVTKEMLPHLLRGIFDGDGSVYTSKGLKVSIYGTTILCEQFKQLLKQAINVKTKTKVFEKPGVSFMNFARKDDVKSIYHYFYDNATVFLTRKKEKFDQNLHLLEYANIERA